ncbi:MAG: hypothetical protein Q8K32_15195 [Archangium sp.]|nr:hypothetical protein [Archangium sp.]
MVITQSFLAEGGWLYVAAALVSVVLILIRAFGILRAATAAGVLLTFTFAVGLFFTASYATAVDQVRPHDPLRMPAPRVLYERCVASGGEHCLSVNPTMDYYLEHRLLGVYVPLGCAAAFALMMLVERRRTAT